MGSFGKLSESDLQVSECAVCRARYLPPVMGDLEEYYRDGTYREDLDQGNTIDRYFELTDDDQPYRLELAGPHSIRRAQVVDVGCGAGSFLDLISGTAARTIAIEPNAAYHASLRERGHRVFDSVKAMKESKVELADLAVSYSVLEHVKNPREFLSDIHHLVHPEGRVIISTPNADDYLLEICAEYRKFFYRKVHLWYFTADALRKLAKLAGYSTCDVAFKHRFDISNAILWLRDKRPTGFGKVANDPHLNDSWRNFLEISGRSDYLYATLRP